MSPTQSVSGPSNQTALTNLLIKSVFSFKTRREKRHCLLQRGLDLIWGAVSEEQLVTVQHFHMSSFLSSCRRFSVDQKCFSLLTSDISVSNFIETVKCGWFLQCSVSCEPITLTNNFIYRMCLTLNETQRSFFLIYEEKTSVQPLLPVHLWSSPERLCCCCVQPLIPVHLWSSPDKPDNGSEGGSSGKHCPSFGQERGHWSALPSHYIWCCDLLHHQVDGGRHRPHKEAEGGGSETGDKKTPNILSSLTHH